MLLVGWDHPQARPVAVYDKIKAEAFTDLLNFTEVIECFLTVELNLIDKNKWKTLTS